jgi:hypothetical protein
MNNGFTWRGIMRGCREKRKTSVFANRQKYSRVFLTGGEKSSKIII